MELKYIFRIIIKWFWLIILLPALAAAGAYYVSVYKMVPVYEASVSMYIVNNDGEARITAVYGDITSAQNAIRNYGEIIKSKSVINEALEALGATEHRAERFAGNINVVFPERNSFVAAISVMDTDPELACRMANKLGEIFVKKTYDLMRMSVIEILDKAEIPTYPSNDKTKKNVGLAVMAGLVFCSVIIFIVEYSGSVIIKNEHDVQKYLGLTVLGAIPDLKSVRTFN